MVSSYSWDFKNFCHTRHFNENSRFCVNLLLLPCHMLSLALSSLLLFHLCCLFFEYAPVVLSVKNFAYLVLRVLLIQLYHFWYRQCFSSTAVLAVKLKVLISSFSNIFRRNLPRRYTNTLSTLPFYLSPTCPTP